MIVHDFSIVYYYWKNTLAGRRELTKDDYKADQDKKKEYCYILHKHSIHVIVRHDCHPHL